MLESASEAARESLSADHEFLGSWCWTSQSAWSTNDKNTEFNFCHLSITLVTTSYPHHKHHSITSECLPSSIPTPVLSAPATISMSCYKSEPSYHAAIAAGFAWPSSNPQHAGEFLWQFLQYHPFGPIKVSQSQLHTLQATWRCCICCMAFTKDKSNKQHPFIPFAKQHLYVQVVYLHDSC